jgi:hypothetical protein
MNPYEAGKTAWVIAGPLGVLSAVGTYLLLGPRCSFNAQYVSECHNALGWLPANADTGGGWVVLTLAVSAFVGSLVGLTANGLLVAIFPGTSGTFSGQDE